MMFVILYLLLLHWINRELGQTDQTFNFQISHSNTFIRPPTHCTFWLESHNWKQRHPKICFFNRDSYKTILPPFTKSRWISASGHNYWYIYPLQHQRNNKSGFGTNMMSRLLSVRLMLEEHCPVNTTHTGLHLQLQLFQLICYTADWTGRTSDGFWSKSCFKLPHFNRELQEAETAHSTFGRLQYVWNSV